MDITSYVKDSDFRAVTLVTAKDIISQNGPLVKYGDVFPPQSP